MSKLSKQHRHCLDFRGEDRPRMGSSSPRPRFVLGDQATIGRTPPRQRPSSRGEERPLFTNILHGTTCLFLSPRCDQGQAQHAVSPERMVMSAPTACREVLTSPRLGSSQAVCALCPADSRRDLRPTEGSGALGMHSWSYAQIYESNFDSFPRRRSGLTSGEFVSHTGANCCH